MKWYLLDIVRIPSEFPRKEGFPKECEAWRGCYLVAHGEGGVLPPAEDDPGYPDEALPAVLEDGVLPESGPPHPAAAALPRHTVTAAVTHRLEEQGVVKE